jgi:hypothetical protein
MKLTDLIYQVASHYRGIENFVRHPRQILEQRTKRIFQDKLETVEIPTHTQRSQSITSEMRSPEVANESRLSFATNSNGLQRQLSSHQSSIRLVENLSIVTDIPLLSERDEIRGRWGRYRRVGEVINLQPHKRLYNGLLVLNDKPVLIHEYLLSEQEFNAREVRECKEAFTALTGLNLRSGDGQDFRLVAPWDAIASPKPEERRCYLITEPINNSCTLREFLTANQAPMSARQVRQVLSQVLQTLWFLHNQKIRLSTGEVLQGLAHGNLSLDSLQIVRHAPHTTDELQFLIYVTDLALWEHLFKPLHHTLSSSTFTQDLIDLGQIGWQLLIGYEESANAPIHLHRQPTATDPALQQFLQQLTQGDFKNDAEAARKTLLGLPPESTVVGIASVSQPDTSKMAGWWNDQHWQTLLILSLIGGCLGALLWMGWRWFSDTSAQWMTGDRPTSCCLTKIPNLPTGQITYAVQRGIWSDVLQGISAVAYNQTLEQELKRRDPRLSQYQLQLTSTNAIAEVQSGKVAFALSEWQEHLPAGLVQQTVAFDGLAVVVAYSDAKRAESIPEAFQGKIRFDQLRQLYGRDRQWQPPNPLQGWKTRLYMPDDPIAVQLFKQQVLNDQAFKPGINVTRSNEMFGAILKDFESDHRLGIGFVRLSKALEQCSVYPLAIAEFDQEVQVVVQDNGKSITPSTDLCNDKGSYWLNPQVFNGDRNLWQHNYPLAYRLVVVYPQTSKVGKRFAAALKTDEGQALLAASGLVPIRMLAH